MGAADNDNWLSLEAEVQNWISDVDNAGAFAELQTLEGLLEKAPEAAVGCDQHVFLTELVAGRRLAENA